jgi:hypothetical protein
MERESMLRKLWALTVTTSVFVAGAIAAEAAPLQQTTEKVASLPDASESPRQFIAYLRICQGDPKGSVEKGTIKVLSRPAIVTTENRPATIVIGGERALPADESVRLNHGVQGEIKPHGLVNGKIRADLKFEITEAMKTGDEDVIGTSGFCLRTSGLFKPGETVKLVGDKSADGKTTWVEVTLDVVTPTTAKR